MIIQNSLKKYSTKKLLVYSITSISEDDIFGFNCKEIATLFFLLFINFNDVMFFHGTHTILCFICLKVVKNRAKFKFELFYWNFQDFIFFLFCSEQRDWIYQKGKTLFIFYANQLHTGLYQLVARSKYFGKSVKRFRIIVVDGKWFHRSVRFSYSHLFDWSSCCNTIGWSLKKFNKMLSQTSVWVRIQTFQDNK